MESFGLVNKRSSYGTIPDTPADGVLDEQLEQSKRRMTRLTVGGAVAMVTLAVFAVVNSPGAQQPTRPATAQLLVEEDSSTTDVVTGEVDAKSSSCSTDYPPPICYGFLMDCEGDVFECSWYNWVCWAWCGSYTDIEYCGFCGVATTSATEAAYEQAVEEANDITAEEIAEAEAYNDAVSDTCGACDGLSDKACLSVLDDQYEAMNDKTKLSYLRYAYPDHDTSMSDKECLVALEAQLASETDKNRLSLLKQACAASS